MAIIQVNLTDTINGFRIKVNTLAENVGDIAKLDTSGGDSNTVSSINAIDSDLGRQANLNYRESADSLGEPVFLTIVDVINRIVDSAGNLDSDMVSGTFDSGGITNTMLADNAIDSNNLIDSVIFGSKFDAMTVLKIFDSTGTTLRKIYGPSRFDKDSADTFKTNPWV